MVAVPPERRRDGPAAALPPSGLQFQILRGDATAGIVAEGYLYIGEYQLRLNRHASQMGRYEQKEIH